MDKNTKKIIKQFKKEIKVFRDNVKKNPDKALKDGKVISKKINDIIKLNDIQNDKKSLNQFNKLKDMMELYIQNMEQLKAFNKKWDKK